MLFCYSVIRGTALTMEAAQERYYLLRKGCYYAIRAPQLPAKEVEAEIPASISVISFFVRRVTPQFLVSLRLLAF